MNKRIRRRKRRILWGRILLLVFIFIVLFLTLYFVFFKDYEKERLLNIGYTEEEIVAIREKLSDSEIELISSYSYLSYLDELVYLSNYNSNNLDKYITYINSIDGNYNLDSVLYLVNNNIDYSYSDKLVSFINHKYFILSRLDRYMSYDGDDIDTIITNVNSNLDYEFYTNIKPSNTSFGVLMIVNKYYSLEQGYYYGDLVKMDKAYDNKSGSMLSSVAYEAFKKLVDDAEKEGYHIRNNSAYRSYNTQSNLYNNYKKNNGLIWADKWSARPGHSEHQTGLALDVGVKNQYSLGTFESSKEFIWMKNNCYKYGFILRYPEGKEYITGYGYEPWHYRYVGIDVATYIYENNITFEEYYAYFVEKN